MAVVFVTIENETGYVNLVSWKYITDHDRRALTASRLVTAYDRLQREGQRFHVITDEPTERLQRTAGEVDDEVEEYSAGY